VGYQRIGPHRRKRRAGQEEGRGKKGKCTGVLPGRSGENTDPIRGQHEGGGNGGGRISQGGNDRDTGQTRQKEAVVLMVKAMVVRGPQGAEEGSKVDEKEVEVLHFEISQVGTYS